MPEEKARCNWCGRDGITVTRDGLLAEHRRKRSRRGKTKNPHCKGSGQWHQNKPEVSTDA